MQEGYSLWFVPTGRPYRNLSVTILKLSRKYGTPRFEPHVTLSGNIFLDRKEVIRRTALLARHLHPFVLTLRSLDYTNRYYRSLFIRVQPTRTLKKARRDAELAFSQHSRTKFEPHLSLLYGRLALSDKKQLISEIGHSLDFQFKPTSIHIVSASSKTRPRQWHRVMEFELSADDGSN